MNETYFKIDHENMYVRHSKIIPDQMTLLFIHGLGDSGLTFEPVLFDRRFAEFNIVIPDLVGYGRSSSSHKPGAYTFDAHLKRLWNLVKTKGLYQLIVIGHSMGGDIATLLCESDAMSLIKKFVNIEGTLTQHDLFLSSRAAIAHQQGRFDQWFRQELMKEIFEEYGKDQSGRDYYANIRYSRPQAYRENAQELVERNTALPGDYQSEIGKIYCNLTVPKVFCYGTENISTETLTYIKKNDLRTQAFPQTGHCPMTDAADEFYTFLHDFIME